MVMALLFSFLCSVADAALLNIPPSYIAELRERDAKQAERLDRLKGDNIDHTLTAEEIMTPRTVMTALQARTTVGQAYEKSGRIPYSRLPLYGKNQDDVLGFVLREDILVADMQAMARQLRERRARASGIEVP